MLEIFIILLLNEYERTTGSSPFEGVEFGGEIVRQMTLEEEDNLLSKRERTEDYTGLIPRKYLNIHFIILLFIFAHQCQLLVGIGGKRRSSLRI